MATQAFDNSLVSYTIYSLLLAITLLVTYIFQKHYFSSSTIAETPNLLEMNSSQTDGKLKEIKEDHSPIKRCCSPIQVIKTPTSFKRKRTLKPLDVTTVSSKSNNYSQRLPLVAINTNTLEATARLNMELNQGLR